jgi:tetratricopeptide (TPR) repeat protein
MTSRSDQYDQDISIGAIPMPDLESPRAFDEWRRTMLTTGSTRDDLVNALMSLQTPIAATRAAQLVLVQPERARAFCALGLTASDRGAYLLAKVVLLSVDIIRAFTDLENPGQTIETPIMLLEGIIRDIQHGENSYLHQEALARAHGVLVDALFIRDDFKEALQHVAEAEVLATALGIVTVIVSARYQRACIAFYQGNVEDAISIYKQVIHDPHSNAVQISRSIDIMAKAIFYQGDEDSLELLLKEQDSLSEIETNFLRLCTLRDAISIWNKDEKTNEINIEAQIWRIIANSQTIFSDQTYAEYSKACKLLLPLINTSHGVMKIARKSIAAFLHLKINNFTGAKARVPTLEETENMPFGVRFFSLVVKLEVLIHDLPNTASEILSILESVVSLLALIPPNILRQIVLKTQLLLPLGLAVISRHPNCPDAVLSVGNESILRFKEKTITVYGSSGIRPAQAIAFILQDFGFQFDIPMDGSGQRDGLAKALNRKYFNRIVWYRPISAVCLAWVFLCCADVVEGDRNYRWVLRAAQELENQYGFKPKTQKLEKDENFDCIIQTILELGRGNLMPDTAAKLLFGDRWSV